MNEVSCSEIRDFYPHFVELQPLTKQVGLDLHAIELELKQDLEDKRQKTKDKCELSMIALI